MGVSFETIESVRSLAELGSLAEHGANSSLKKLLDSLPCRAKDNMEIALFFRICDSFSLDTAERLIFANCFWRYNKGLDFQTANWMWEFRGRIESENPQREISFLLDPHHSELLVHACSLLLNRSAQLPDYLHLQAGGETIFHGFELLDEMDSFLNRCAQNEEITPAVVALFAENGAGRRFLLTQLAHRKLCVLLTVDSSAAIPQNAPLIAGLALLYDAMIVLIDYDSSALPLLERLFDWFSVIFITSESPVENIGTRCRAFFSRKVEALTSAQRESAIAMLFPQCSREEQARAANTYRL
ncbi:MAG: hypothetical protein RR315_05445, partial [Oscillospiraceae bacterium]